MEQQRQHRINTHQANQQRQTKAHRQLGHLLVIAGGQTGNACRQIANGRQRFNFCRHIAYRPAIGFHAQRDVTLAIAAMDFGRAAIHAQRGYRRQRHAAGAPGDAQLP